MPNNTYHRQSSPIRHLDGHSPNRAIKLHPIAEEDAYQITVNKNPINHSVSYDSPDRVYLQKIKHYANQSNRTMIQNSRLSKQNQILRDNQIIGMQMLNKQLLYRDIQNNKLLSDMNLLKQHYNRDLQRMAIENQSLRKQLANLSEQKTIQTHQIRQKYERMSAQDLNLAKKVYLTDIQKIIEAHQSTKYILYEKQVQLRDLAHINKQISKQYNKNLQHLISENNILRNKVIKQKLQKGNEIKQSQQKSQLQRSRNTGLMNHHKQTNAFIQKQIHRLASQLMQKNISIDTFTKTILKMQKQSDSKYKKYQAKIRKIEQEKKKQVKQFEKLIGHMSKMHKDEADNLRRKQIDIRERLNTCEQENINLKRQIQHLKSVLQKNEDQNKQLKATINRMHDEHSKDVQKLMTDSRKSWGSLRNISDSYKKDENKVTNINAQNIDKNLDIVEEQDSIINDNKDNLMKETQSDGIRENDNMDLHSLVIQYENRIKAVQNDRQLQLQIVREQNKRLKRNLNEKQQQTLQILKRFSPLMEIKLNSQTAEQQRSQKINRYHKADLDILDVMLNKHQLAYLTQNRR